MCVRECVCVCLCVNPTDAELDGIGPDDRPLPTQPNEGRGGQVTGPVSTLIGVLYSRVHVRRRFIYCVYHYPRAIFCGGGRQPRKQQANSARSKPARTKKTTAVDKNMPDKGRGGSEIPATTLKKSSRGERNQLEGVPGWQELPDVSAAVVPQRLFFWGGGGYAYFWLANELPSSVAFRLKNSRLELHQMRALCR